MNISTILSQIALGSIALPEFQRGYVWNRDAESRGKVISYGRLCPAITHDTP